MSGRGYVTVTVMYKRMTDKAVEVSATGDPDDPTIWIPKSKIGSMEIVHEDEEIYEISIPEWIALREGLI